MCNSEWRLKLLSLSIGALLPLTPALACGPDFPYRLLGDRENALRELPEGNFGFETSRLGTRIPGLGQAGDATLDRYWDEDQQRYIDARVAADQQQLSAEQASRSKALRQLSDARQVERDGADLPPELRLYTAGAVAFAQGEHAVAAEYFRRVLALPVGERALRSTWASYSLGRSLALLAVSAPVEAMDDVQLAAYQQRLRQEAVASFQQVRQQVAAGLADPLELGIASLGEEARLRLDEGNWGAAIRLYASQSLHNSSTGYSSLRQVARELAQLPDAELRSALHSLEVQQLLTAQVLTRIDDYDGQRPVGGERLLHLLREGAIAKLENADRLAALSYQSGDYQGAQDFLQHAGDGGLAWWLRAKLALRDGDKTTAAQAYAKAAKAFPADEDWGWRRNENWQYETLKPHCRVQGEAAILAMERGDYLEAFDQLYRSGEVYWQDAAEVAERVLSTDELKAYVDQNVQAAPIKDGEEYAWERPVPNRLRQLLGRRLLREQRYEEAVTYFVRPELQAAARDYGQARDAADSAWGRIARAEAYYKAAVLARVQGMELLGYELAPDSAWSDGNYGAQMQKPVQAAGLLSPAEATLQNATMAQPNRRYHYRWVAADLANRSADLLPARSQAFAATLCKATGWLINNDPDTARSFYRRYVEHGAYIPLGAAFGTPYCDEPDFERARDRLWVEREQAARELLRPFKYSLPAALLAAAAAFIYWRRRRAGLAIVDKTAEESRNE